MPAGFVGLGVASSHKKVNIKIKPSDKSI
jgi:hypothetical protein